MSLRIDMHVHTRYSGDSWLDPAAVVSIAKARGLDGIAVTDHGTIRGGLEARAANRDPAFTVVVGAEYATDCGHVVGLFLERELELARVAGQVLRYAAVVDAIHAQGGIAVLAHPFQVRLDLAERAFSAEARADAIETLNARAVAARNQAANAQAAEFAAKHGIPPLGCSDAHLAREIGCGLTWFHELAPGAAPAAIRQAILAGQGTALGSGSPRIVIPLSQVARMLNRGEYGRAPKIAVKLLLTALGPFGLRIENVLRRPAEEDAE